MEYFYSRLLKIYSMEQSATVIETYRNEREDSKVKWNVARWAERMKRKKQNFFSREFVAQNSEINKIDVTVSRFNGLLKNLRRYTYIELNLKCQNIKQLPFFLSLSLYFSLRIS